MSKTTHTKTTVQEKPSQLEDRVVMLEENWKRALADYQNLLRRVENDKMEFTRMSNANLIARLLPSLDIIELSASHNTSDLGVQMAAKQFHQALVGEGLEVVEPLIGENFNPNLHDCSETVDLIEETSENTISELILKGYKIGEYILRPARVKVYKQKLDVK